MSMIKQFVNCSIALFLVAAVIPMYGTGQEQLKEKKPEGNFSHTRQLLSGFTATVCTGAVSGIATGALVKYAEKQIGIEPWSLAAWLVTWPIEASVRAGLLIALQKDCESHGITLNVKLMQTAAFFGSIFGYGRV